MTRRSKAYAPFSKGGALMSCSTPPPSRRASTRRRERRLIRSMRRCCRWCWLEPASMSGAPPSAGWAPRISRCMSRCRRSMGESSPAPFPSRRPARATHARNSARSRIVRSPIESTSPLSLHDAGRRSGAWRRGISASLACCRITQRVAGAPAMRWASIRPRAPSPFARHCAPRGMTSPAIWTRLR